MSVGIVDLLEFIEIDDQSGQLASMPSAFFNGHFGAVAE